MHGGCGGGISRLWQSGEPDTLALPSQDSEIMNWAETKNPTASLPEPYGCPWKFCFHLYSNNQWRWHCFTLFFLVFFYELPIVHDPCIYWFFSLQMCSNSFYIGDVSPHFPTNLLFLIVVFGPHLRLFLCNHIHQSSLSWMLGCLPKILSYYKIK